jgi:hypothetical protein
VSITGGSSLPCIVTAEDSSGSIAGAYVVKLYPKDAEDLQRRTASEFLCAILAKEFGLPTPEPIVIEMGIEIMGQLWKDPRYEKKRLEPGNYFGCTFLEGGLDFTNPLPTGKINLVDVESVFGFDMLIRNWDRRAEKPNCFFKDNLLYLIDHEYGLYIPQTFDWHVKNDGWQQIAYREKGQHLMLPYLKKRKKQGRINFYLFEEHLRFLDLSKLHGCLNELEDFDIFAPDFTAVFDYLAEAKAQPHIFVNQILTLI